ncbi:MAG TPA: acyl-ACP--UDP-N-acetylglucosamine O-acyltransferase [Sedimentisphaerales bacterium]|nr:acyl-ACP--UDP-N-acetylglucosamine O-acyltransferase [Sedimentisphaerales bacterium]
MINKMSQIHSSAVIGAGAKLAEDVNIGPNCVIGSGVEIGSGCIFEPNVVVGKDVKIGKNNHFFSNCSIGGWPQILGMKDESKIGKLEIGDGNVIREQVTIHPSMHKDGLTKVGSNNLLMIGVHIGHDCVLEDMIVMSNYVQISGHCHIGKGVWLSGMVLLHQFITMGNWCYAAGMTGVNHDIPPFVIVSGHYPPRVRGVNKRGLSRAGLDEQAQKNVMRAYKALYRTGGSLLANATALAKEDWIDDNVRSMLDVIFNSTKHRYGRYLETFRD